MEAQSIDKIRILPVPAGTDRPLWSVMIPTYNCANELRDTLQSILRQDPGPESMHIEVVDDCSTKDDPKAVVEEVGKGRVEFYRQPNNVGAFTNFDTCLQRSRGQLVHLLHGDDLVMYGFYSKMQAAFKNNEQIGAAVCRHVYIDSDRNWKFISPLEELKSCLYSNWVDQIAIRHRIQPPAIVVKREVYERLGGFDHRLCCNCEDWEMWARVAANYPIWYETEPLAMYRQASKGTSLTSRCIQTGQNSKDYLMAINIIQDYIPEKQRESARRTSLERNALELIRIGGTLIQSGQLKTASTQILAALKLRPSLKVLSELTKTALKMFIKSLAKKA